MLSFKEFFFLKESPDEVKLVHNGKKYNLYFQDKDTDKQYARAFGILINNSFDFDGEKYDVFHNLPNDTFLVSDVGMSHREMIENFLWSKDKPESFNNVSVNMIESGGYSKRVESINALEIPSKLKTDYELPLNSSQLLTNSGRIFCIKNNPSIKVISFWKTKDFNKENVDYVCSKLGINDKQNLYLDIPESLGYSKLPSYNEYFKSDNITDSDIDLLNQLDPEANQKKLDIAYQKHLIGGMASKNAKRNPIDLKIKQKSITSESFKD